MSKIQLLNTEVEIDFLDAETNSKIEEGCEEVNKKTEELNCKISNMKFSEVIKEECMLIRNFVDKILGKGMSNKIFGNKYSLYEVKEVFEVIIAEKIKQQEELFKFNKKYSTDRLKR